MSLELYIKFDDQNWLASNSNKVQQAIENLDSFTLKKSNTEFWLKDDPSDGGWDFDVRIFLLDSSLLVEVSSTTSAYLRDLKSLWASLSQQTNVDFVDEDGEEVII